MNDSAFIDERALSKLIWRCRRGLLENDLLIERFFTRHDSGITVRQARALDTLMDLSDNDLLDLLLRRTEPKDALAADEVVELLTELRPQPTTTAPLSRPKEIE